MGKKKSQWLGAKKVFFLLMQSPQQVWVTLGAGHLHGGSA